MRRTAQKAVRQVPDVWGTKPHQLEVLPLLFQHAFDRKASNYKWAQFSEIKKELGPIFRQSVLGANYIVVSTPSLAEQVLNGPNYRRGSNVLVDTIQRVAPQSFAAAEGEAAQHLRESFMSIFSEERMLSYVPIIEGQAQAMCDGVQYLVAERGAAKIDLQEMLSDCTFDILGKCLFGLDFGAHDSAMNQQVQPSSSPSRCFQLLNIEFHEHLRGAATVTQNPLRQRKLRSAGERCRQVLAQILDERRRVFLGTMSGGVQDLNDSASASGDVDVSLFEQLSEGTDFLTTTLSRLPTENLANSPLFSETIKPQIIDQAIALFLFGFEASASASTWALYYLTQNPDIYARLTDEADRLLPGKGSLIFCDKNHSQSAPSTFTNHYLRKLNFTEQCLLESMRLTPPMPFLLRTAVRDHFLEIDDGETFSGTYPISVNSNVLVASHAIHRDQNAWSPNPNEFEPDRFAPLKRAHIENTAKYIPFGLGPRSCLGDEFSLMISKTLIASLSKSFQFSHDTGAAQEFPKEGPKLHQLVVPRMEDFMVGVRPRFDPIWDLAPV